MGNQKMQEFRKRSQKEAVLNQQKQGQDIQQMFKMLLGLASRLYAAERRMNALFPTAKIADWRSLAIMKLLDEEAHKIQPAQLNITEARVIAKAEQLQVETFEADSAEDDIARKLEPVSSEASAAKGMFAVATMKLYNKGQELEEQRVVRTKIEIGMAELFPELDEVVVGMKVGESKRFPFSLQGKTDEAEVTLLGLRKKPEPVEPAKEGSNEQEEAPGSGSGS
jgi:hypothetical protein